MYLCYAVSELDKNYDLKSKYIYTNGLLLGRIDSSDAFYQYYHDGLGSIMDIHERGDYKNLYLYDEFGKFLKKSEDVTNSYLYTGQEYDTLPSQMYNLRARYYDAGIGRFTQEDPVDYDWGRPQRMNLYVYVMNNPINMLDPLGLKCYPITPWIPHFWKLVSSKIIKEAKKWKLISAWSTGPSIGGWAGSLWYIIYCEWSKKFTIEEHYQREIERLVMCIGHCGWTSIQGESDIQNKYKPKPKYKFKFTHTIISSPVFEWWACKNMDELQP